MVLQQLQLDLATLRDAAERALAAIDVLLGPHPDAEPEPVTSPVVVQKAPVSRPRYKNMPSSKQTIAEILRTHPARRFTVEGMLEAMKKQGWETSSATATQYLRMLLNRYAKDGMLTRTVSDSGQGRAVIYYSERVKES